MILGSRTRSLGVRALIGLRLFALLLAAEASGLLEPEGGDTGRTFREATIEFSGA